MIFSVVLIGFVFVYIIYSMVTFNDESAGRQVESVQRILDRALVQVYALEGAFPTAIEHLENYGIILDTSRYIYFYEWYASNMKPTVIVLEAMR
jgi:hypothetical protein